MLKSVYSEKQLWDIVNRQMLNFWPLDDLEGLYRWEIDEGGAIKNVWKRLEICFSQNQSKYIKDGKDVIFAINHSVSYSIFLYILSNELYSQGYENSAAYVYYLNKIMHGVDWFYAVKLPDIFMAEHPVSSVLGRAVYQDYFMLYQGCTVGGNRKNNVLNYPVLGHHVLMFANSTLLGNSHVGNYVVISAETYIKDMDIPDYSIVFGKSPNIVIKKRTKEEMKKRFMSIWNINE